ncbi:MAG: SIMPL domain-containing protein [Chloroflexi bacterium]|nr:SIMPL domain-containing protein [Chloroflexota bacterium]
MNVTSRTLTVAALVIGALATATALGLATRAIAAPAQPVLITSGQQMGINVNGESKVTVTPDVANLTIGVENRSATVEEARNKAAEAMDALIKRLAALGIDKKDIKTQSLNISPEYKRQPTPTAEMQIDGYRVSNMVQVKVRKLDTLSAVIDQSAGAAGDNVRLQGISFGVDDPAASLVKARELALKDAKAKADLLAKLSGVSVGKPVSIQDLGNSGPIIAQERMMANAPMASKAMDTPVEPGQTEIRVAVQVVYSIE